MPKTLNKRATAAPSPTSTEIRRAAACRAFWSSHPLNLAYRDAIGADTFTLKPFVAFVVDMPDDRFAACMFGVGVVR